MKKSKYAKIGDKVWVITPKLFVRCGYPLYPAKILEERKGEVRTLMYSAWHAMGNRTFGLTVPKLSYEDLPPWIETRLRNMAITVILHREGFGGKERKIYEKENINIQDRILTVIGKRFVRTGTYRPAVYNHYYWSDDSDWELPSLENAKMHCIYQLDTSNMWLGGWDFARLGKTEILAEHCSKDAADKALAEKVIEVLDAARGE